MVHDFYLSPSSSSSVKRRPKRPKAITTTNAAQLDTPTRNSISSSKAMAPVDCDGQSSRSDVVYFPYTEPPPGCDKDSLWWALVTVASQKYDEMMVEEERKRQQAAEAARVEPTPVASVPSVGQNVVVAADEDDGEGRLVIDEGNQQPSPPPQEQEPSTSSAVQKKTPREEPAASGQNGGSSGYQVAIKAVRRPRHMSQVTVDPTVPFQVPVRYNANMARKFPGAENRTPEQQAVRERNTVAARQSRAKMKMMEEMLQQEATDERTLNEYVKTRVASCCTYGNALRVVLDMEEADFWAEFQLVKDQYIAEPVRSLHVVPRIVSDESCYSDEEDEDEDYEESEDEEPQPGTSGDSVGNRRG